MVKDFFPVVDQFVNYFIHIFKFGLVVRTGMTHPGAERLPAPPVCAVPEGADRSAGLHGLSVHGILPAYKMKQIPGKGSVFLTILY